MTATLDGTRIHSAAPGGAQLMTSVNPLRLLTILAALVLGATSVAHAQGDAQRGAKLFPQCAACHTLEPGRNLTGPSLANLFGRKAGTVSNFLRYSDTLKRSGVVWDEKTLDAWLKDPEKFIPGNDMVFPGIKEDAVRRDLIAYLKAADATLSAQRAGPRMPNLKKAKPDSIVKSVRHCGDTYFVATEDGKTHKIWEFNLRFKTDTSDSGPAPGKPVLLGVGMRGDRVAIVFATPSEFASFIKEQCE
jgi:cytochrome c